VIFIRIQYFFILVPPIHMLGLTYTCLLTYLTPSLFQNKYERYYWTRKANYSLELEINLKIWDGRSVGNVNKNVYAKFRCAPLRIKEASEIYGELMPRTRRRTTTRVAFWDPPSGSKEQRTMIWHYCDSTWLVTWRHAYKLVKYTRSFIHHNQW